MKFLLGLSLVISLLAGVLFYAVSGQAIMLVVPAIVNFSFVGIAYLACRYILKEEFEEEEEYSSYQSAHSL